MHNTPLFIIIKTFIFSVFLLFSIKNAMIILVVHIYFHTFNDNKLLCSVYSIPGTLLRHYIIRSSFNPMKDLLFPFHICGK